VALHVERMIGVTFLAVICAVFILVRALHVTTG
jgi:hypothetical protein